MSTTPKLYTLAEARKLVAEEDASSAPSWSLDSPRFIATVEALDAAQAAFEQLQRAASSAAEKYLAAINDSEARAQAAQALVRRLHGLAFREGSNPDLNGDPEADLRKAFGTQQARVRELEAELAEVRRVLGGDHSFPMSYLAAQVSAEKLGFKRMLKERDEAERSLTEARASEARMREALANLEAACASVASWSEECLDYSDATRVAARKLLAKLEG